MESGAPAARVVAVAEPMAAEPIASGVRLTDATLAARVLDPGPERGARGDPGSLGGVVRAAPSCRAGGCGRAGALVVAVSIVPGPARPRSARQPRRRSRRVVRPPRPRRRQRPTGDDPLAALRELRRGATVLPGPLGAVPRRRGRGRVVGVGSGSCRPPGGPRGRGRAAAPAGHGRGPRRATRGLGPRRPGPGQRSGLGPSAEGRGRMADPRLPRLDGAGEAESD